MTPTAPAPINLTPDGEDWLNFTIAGRSFDVALVDAMDELSIIDHRHLDDPNECLACKHRWTPRAVPVEPGQPITCPACQSPTVAVCRAFLDDVAKLLTEQHGIPRCSRNAAAMYYTAVREAWDEAKKKRVTTPESHTGTESTPPDGAAPASEPGSSNSPAATPSDT